jgi:hypothetical protein
LSTIPEWLVLKAPKFPGRTLEPLSLGWVIHLLPRPGIGECQVNSSEPIRNRKQSTYTHSWIQPLQKEYNIDCQPTQAR